MNRRLGIATDAVSSNKLLEIRREIIALRLESMRGALDPGRALMGQIRVNSAIIKALYDSIQQDALPPQQVAIIQQELSAIVQEEMLLWDKWDSYDPITGKFDKKHSSSPSHYDIKTVQAI
jgi:hypothetical protein